MHYTEGKIYAWLFYQIYSLEQWKEVRTNLPIEESYPVLYDHFDLCKHRLEQIFKKLKSDKELLKKYNDVFAEQLKQGIIE